MTEKNELKKGFIIPLITLIFEKSGRFFIVRGHPWGEKFVEAFVLFCLIIEIFFLSLLLAFPSLSNNIICIIVVTVILCYRVLDILNKAYYWLIISPFRNVKEWQISSTPRLLFLNLVNYLEFWIIFGIFCFLARDGFNPMFSSAWDSFYYSINVITTFGTNVEPISVLSKVIYISEIAIGLTFIIVIIARAISLLPYNRSKIR